jgi:hypothetical protein
MEDVELSALLHNRPNKCSRPPHFLPSLKSKNQCGDGRLKKQQQMRWARISEKAP